MQSFDSNITNPYDAPDWNLNAQEDMSCCICMDDFSGEVVILPCKAHFFHENCISQWM